MVMGQEWYSIPKSPHNNNVDDNNNGDNLPIISGINHKQSKQSHKTFGTYKCMTGDEVTHLNFLMGKSKEINEKVLNGQLNERQSGKAYQSCYIPALLYSLAATSKNRDQINNIQQQAVSTFLNLAGYERHFPRPVVFLPIYFGGLGRKQLYVECNCNKIETIICQINENSKLGKLLMINLNTN
jgi:hypothetical protein